MTNSNVIDSVLDNLGDNVLEHKLIGGGGTRTFKETNVKRDGRGRFATKAERAEKKWEDELWLTQLGVVSKAADKLKAFSKQYAKEHGYSEAELEDPTGKPGLVEGVTKIMNEAADDPVFYSPSGDQKVEFKYNSEKKEVYAVPVKRSARHDGMELSDDELVHYGVKGMKWGVIRSRTRSGTSAPSSEDAARARDLLAKPSTSVTNAEIQEAINRMRLESQFNDLKKSMAPVTRMDRAKRFVGKLMGEIGSNEVNRVAKGAASIAVEQALKKGGKVDLDKEFAKKVGERIVPKKK